MTAAELRELLTVRILKDQDTRGVHELMRPDLMRRQREGLAAEEVAVREVRAKELPELLKLEGEIAKARTAFAEANDAVSAMRLKHQAQLAPLLAKLHRAHADERALDHQHTRRRMELYRRLLPTALWRELCSYWREVDAALIDEARRGDGPERAGISAALEKLRNPTGGAPWPDGDTPPPEDLCAWFAAHLNAVAEARERATAEARDRQTANAATEKLTRLLR